MFNFWPFKKKKKDRYWLLWSDSFNAWQVYMVGDGNRYYVNKYFLYPKYFKGWAITKETKIKALNYFEAGLGGKQYKEWI